jgi:RNA polymerase sigma factor (sigma-70 family)
MPTAELNPLAPAEPTNFADRDVRARGSATDATLVRRMRGGDERAFETIFKRHHAPLLSYCRHMLASLDEAEDALQQTFIRAHRALLGESPPRELRPWLYAIARNCCLSAIAARRSTDELDERTPSLGGLSEEVHGREELRELVTDIAALPEDQRSALLLSELDDLSHRAIADVVGCPVSKVKALVYQARTALMAERAARSASCRDIREELAIARGGALRRGPLRRHVRLCSGCRDFQLAVETQRQSLAIVLPVLPSAALAARIFGHGALHAVAGAAGVGQAGAGIAPAAGGTSAVSGTSAAAGTSAVAGTSAAAGGGTGVVAAGGAAAGTTATAGTAVVSTTSASAWIGGGLVAKVAVGGAVAALATVGAVAIPHRPWRASRHTAHGALHSGARSTSAAATGTGGGVASNAVFASAPGLSQASPAALQGPSPAGSVELGLSGLVSPTAGLEAAATGARPPGSGSTSPLPGAGGVTAPTNGTVAATLAGRRAQARRARLQKLRNRRRLLEHRQRLRKRRLLRKKRRLLLKQRKHRKLLPTVKPPLVAPTVAAPAPKPTHRKKKTPQAASSPTPSTSSTTTADQTPTKHRKTRTAEGGATGASPTAAGTTPTSTGTAPTSTGTTPTSTGTTPKSRKTGKGSTTGSASGTATGESSGTGTSPATGKETDGGTGSGTGSSSSGGGSSSSSTAKHHKPSTAADGSATSEPLEENTLDANQPSDQPLG